MPGPATLLLLPITATHPYNSPAEREVVIIITVTPVDLLHSSCNDMDTHVPPRHSSYSFDARGLRTVTVIFCALSLQEWKMTTSLSALR